MKTYYITVNGIAIKAKNLETARALFTYGLN